MLYLQARREEALLDSRRTKGRAQSRVPQVHLYGHSGRRGARDPPNKKLPRRRPRSIPPLRAMANLRRGGAVDAAPAIPTDPSGGQAWPQIPWADGVDPAAGAIPFFELECFREQVGFFRRGKNVPSPAGVCCRARGCIAPVLLLLFFLFVCGGPTRRPRKFRTLSSPRSFELECSGEKLSTLLREKRKGSCGGHAPPLSYRFVKTNLSLLRLRNTWFLAGFGRSATMTTGPLISYTEVWG